MKTEPITDENDLQKYVCRNCGKPFWSEWDPETCPHCGMEVLFEA